MKPTYKPRYEPGTTIQFQCFEDNWIKGTIICAKYIEQDQRYVYDICDEEKNVYENIVCARIASSEQTDAERRRENKVQIIEKVTNEMLETAPKHPELRKNLRRLEAAMDMIRVLSELAHQEEQGVLFTELRDGGS